MQHHNLRVAGLAAAVSLALQSAPAFSQLEEVIVTANKRSESLNEVGMTVSVLSEQTIEDRGLSSLEDFAVSVPGLTFTPSTTNTPILTLRGVGFNESSLGVYPAVSLYIDQAPLPFPALASRVAFDLERVEVLKGPQGTLFGQNSTGGAINFIAAKPTDEFAAGADVSYGSFSRTEFNGYVSGPLSDTVRARVAVNGVTADGWQESNTRAGDENGEEDYFAARFLMDFTPSDSTTISLNLNMWQDESDPLAQQLIAVTPGVPVAAGPQHANIAYSPQNPEAADWSTDNCLSNPSPGGFDYAWIGVEGIDPYPLVDDCSGAYSPKGDREMFQASLRGDFDLNDDLTLTTLVSYAEYDQNQRTDGDGMNLVTAELDKHTGSIDTLSAEIRLGNSAENQLRWIVGANYEDSETLENQNLRYWDNTNYAANLFINNSGYELGQQIESYAFFFNTEYDVNEAFTLRAGARYTDTTIDASECGYAAGDGRVADLFNYLGGLFNPAEMYWIGGYPDCFTLNDRLVGGELYTNSLSEDNVSWKVGVDYHLSEDSLVYANVSQGYKAGSYPALSVATWDGYEPVTQESVLAYELGIKSSMADGRVQFNGAVFYSDYEDKQVRGKLLDPIFGALDKLFNVPESDIFGAEIEVAASPVDGLTLSAAVTYLDSEIKRHSGSNAYGIIDDFSGDSIPFTPELTYSLNADYRMTLSSGGELFMGATYAGQSESDAVLSGERLSITESAANNGISSEAAIASWRGLVDKPFVIDSFATLDARLGYITADDKWKVMLFGKNLTDEYYWTTVIPSFDSAGRFAGRPRTWGVMVSYDY